jgi:hypothetical protein
MPVDDLLPLREMLQGDGWRIARRGLEEKAHRLQRKLETEPYESLIDVKADQEQLRFLRKLLAPEAEVLQFLAPRG